MIDFQSKADKKIHFIGIGGIGMSALAGYYLTRGAEVSGSDLVSSEITEKLAEGRVKVKIGSHKKSNLPPDVDLVIHTAAVNKENPELKEAKKRRIKTQSYGKAIGELTRRYKTVAVSGAHGKSTTTSLAALVLEEGYGDPTVIVGTKLKEFGNSNFRSGRGPYLVLEADEYNKHFLNCRPYIAVITNIDAEHLDTYKNVSAVEGAFEKYLAKVSPEGKIVANFDDERTRRVAQKFGKKVVWYSLKNPEAKILRKILKIPGEHNVSNALAAMRVGQILGVSQPQILKALSGFGGAWRRFELKGLLNKGFIITDYGHHPAEIRATINAARARFPFRRIFCVYQPHQYQRLSYLWNDFVGAFDLADIVCLLPVYDVAGRETAFAKAEVNSRKLAKEIARRGKTVFHQPNFKKAENFLRAEARSGDIILIMGAGDIYNLAQKLAAV